MIPEDIKALIERLATLCRRRGDGYIAELLNDASNFDGQPLGRAQLEALAEHAGRLQEIHRRDRVGVFYRNISNAAWHGAMLYSIDQLPIWSRWGSRHHALGEMRKCLAKAIEQA